MSKKKYNSRFQIPYEKNGTKIKSVFSSNEVTLFDLEENADNANKNTEESIEENTSIEKAKSSDEEDVTLSSSMCILGFPHSSKSLSSPDQESDSTTQPVFGKNDQAPIELERDNKNKMKMSLPLHFFIPQQ